jgi:biotin carboxyl carrier protein
MTLYNVTISGNEYRVDLSGNRSTVNGSPIKAGILALNNNGLFLLRRTKQSVALHMNPLDADTLNLLVGSQRVVTRVVPNHRRRLQKDEDQKSGALTAPMNGVVVDVLVAEGDEVEKGQTLVVLESMKMQMQMRASQAGKVMKIAVNKNQQVEKGSLLVQVS